MVTNASDIQKGMDVMSSDGQKIGGVADVYPYAGAEGTYARSGMGTSGTAGATGTAGTTGTYGSSDTTGMPGTAGTFGGGTTSVTGYFKVDQGGVLGIGAKELYIPFSAVTNVVPGQNLTVDCTKDTCDSLYGNKPDFIP